MKSHLLVAALLYVVEALQNFIPPEFNQICRVQSPVLPNYPTNIKCDISANDTQTWRLDTLRKWALTRNDTFLNPGYSYDISCNASAQSVSIPWPMSSLGLRALKVQKCNITDMFADFLNPELNLFPDQLIELELIDSVVIFKHSKMIYMFKHVLNITSEYECIHPKTIQKLVYRNVAYQIDDDFTLPQMVALCMQENFPLPELTEANVNASQSLFDNTISNPSEQTPFTGNTIPLLPGLPEPPLNNNNTNMPPIDLGLLMSNDSDHPCTIKNIIEDIIDLPKRLKHVQIECNYQTLIHIEDSASTSMSVYHHRFLTKFNKFPVLRFLNFSSNHIDVIPDELYDWTFYFNVLNHMDLSHNRLSVIKFRSGFTDKLVNDTYINLQFNNITTLRTKDLDMLGEQRKTFIDIRNNPLHCGCDLLEFIETILDPETFTGKMKKYEYIKDMKCATPENLAGKPLKVLNRDVLLCNPIQGWIIPFAALAVIAIIFGGTTILGFIYRREIRILFYTRLNILMPGEVYTGLGQKLFHAFVSYSNEDEDWIEDCLCRKLEHPDPDPQSKSRANFKKEKLREFKLCLHGRNFIPGVSIIENIIHSVQNSRHTIIVLSTHFVNSKWAMEEFVQAYNQSIMERRRHLIIVVLDEVPDQKLDPLLRRCMKTFTYLKVSDKLFYDRLAYSLSFENKLTKSEIAREESIKNSNKISFISSKLTEEEVTFSRLESMSTISSCLSTQCSNSSTESADNCNTHL